MADIKARLVVEGEKEFKQAIKDAKEEVKLYTAEQKAASTATDGSKTSTDSLKKAIEAQKTVYDTYEERIKAVQTALKSEGKSQDEVEAATRRMRTEAANAKTKLNELERQLSDVESAAEGAKNSADDGAGGGIAGAFKKLGETTFNFNNITTAFSNIASGVKAALDLVQQFGAAAQNTINTSYETGFSTEQIQRMQYAEKMLGLDGSMTTAANKVGAAMLDPTKAAALRAYGVDTTGNGAAAAESLMSLLNAEWVSNGGGLSSGTQGLMKQVFGEDGVNSMNALVAQFDKFLAHEQNANVLTDAELEAEAEANQKIIEAQEKLGEAMQEIILTIADTGVLDAVVTIASLLDDVVKFLAEQFGKDSSTAHAEGVTDQLLGMTHRERSAYYQSGGMGREGVEEWLNQIIEVDGDEAAVQLLADLQAGLDDAGEAKVQVATDNENVDAAAAAAISEAQSYANRNPVYLPVSYSLGSGGHLNDFGVDVSWRNPFPHASGIAAIPYDGYPAVLHKGEAVLTSSQAQMWRAGGNGGNGGVNADAIGAAVRGALVGMTVTMDGETVGTLVAPSVSRAIYAGV